MSDPIVAGIAHVQSLYSAGKQFAEIFNHLLGVFLRLTDSEYGFVGEVLQSAEGKPYLRTHAVTNIAWDDASRAFYERHAPTGLRFYNLDTLFGAVLVTGRAVLANEPATDPRRGGLPAGHPPLNAFMGLPFSQGDAMVGMVGLANRSGGYSEEQARYLEPLLLTCSNTIMMYRNDVARAEVEAQLQRERATTQAILNSAHEAIISIDANGVIQSANRAATAIFGYATEELIGANVSRLMPEPHASDHDGYIRAYLRTRQRKVIGVGREVRGRRKDGSLFPLELAISEVSAPMGTLFTGICRDLTERKLAEQQARQRLEELHRSHEDLCKILDQLDVGVLTFDDRKQLTHATRGCSCLELAGMSLEVGRHWRELLPLDSSAAREFERRMRQDAEAVAAPLLARWTNQDGSRCFVELSVRVDPRDSDGRIVYLYDRTELHTLRESDARPQALVGDSPPMQALYRQVADVARGDWTVLIEGETGAGKELVARAIHAASPRRDRPFIAVNCAGLQSSLLASQLFGHRKGAFTGAVTDQEGLFQAAEGGTLFLDEVGDIPPALQASLLRVLQEGEILPIGHARARRVDVRVIAATNADLAARVDAGAFRRDLLFRIRVGRILVPPLRERRDDLKQLCELFLAQARLAMGHPIFGFSPQALQSLRAYRWPGNVRELKAAVDFAVIHCRSALIQVNDLPPEVATAHEPNEAASTARVSPAASRVTKAEVLAAITRAGGNRSEAAKNLGIGRATLYRRLRE